MSTEDNIVNISVFGSYGRGTPDKASDLDILVLCHDGGGVQPEDFVRSKVANLFDQSPSISWYGERKIRNFFSEGDLFSWHLYNESFPLPGYKHIREIFGKPTKYRNCEDDVRGLFSLLSEIPGNILKCPHNIIFELGVAYVCLRNIAMSASSVLCDQVDFGRYSPYSLPHLRLPIDPEDYAVLAGCRHASTRGMEPPNISLSVERTLERSISWGHEVQGAVTCRRN